MSSFLRMASAPLAFSLSRTLIYLADLSTSRSTYYRSPLNAFTTRNAILIIYILLYRDSSLPFVDITRALVVIISLIVFLFAENLLMCQLLTLSERDRLGRPFYGFGSEPIVHFVDRKSSW